MAKAKSSSKAASVKRAYPAFDSQKAHTLAEAVKLLKSFPSAKFDESVDVALNMNLDPKYNDQNIRSLVVLPNGTGKTVRVAVMARGAAADEAQKAGADIVGTDDLIKDIEAGKINFDRLIATPDCMPMLGKVAKILGPKGMMPNPKLGSVTPTPARAVKDAKAGQVEFKLDKGGVIHAIVGRKSFAEPKLVENIAALIKAVKDAKPAGAKVVYMKKLVISATMSPAIVVDLKSVSA